ncbi:MAG: autotransporter outer membrane beta-barrel domain-containing protein, partial [Aequorivita sp.]|nr:autotransporter outer membrane beta-barrel domain-containing protein [Aequorivita sp.]
MKPSLFFIITCIGLNVFSQTPIDSIHYLQLKEQIKNELREELKNDSTIQNQPIFSFKNFSLKGYGAINYYNFDFDTDPTLKDKIDIERLNLYLGYNFTEKISLKSEIEFEHGGTGASIGYDTQEEFGEFDEEIEKGGSVKLEQLYTDFKIANYFNIRAGRMKVYFGLHQTLDEPTSYFTTYRQEMENEILPLGWYENGLEFYGTFAK